MKENKALYIILLIVTSLILNSCKTMNMMRETDKKQFTNPIIADGADPWIIRSEDFYYYCYSDGNRSIFIKKTKDITEIEKSLEKQVWRSPLMGIYSKETWAPELHLINGKWYIYFAADDGKNVNHRMFVLESKTADPLGEYELKGEIANQYDRWGIDGTTMMHENGSMYYIWSGWEGFENVAQHIYIAKMENPWTVSGERVMISSPEYNWEIPSDGPKINEGPQVLKLGDSTHIIYSANGSWTDNYCYGMLTWIGGDPLIKESWEKSYSPVFESGNGIYAPGHGSFIKSPDGKENWMIYHSAKQSGSGWDRQIRAQEFTIDDNNFPIFGSPIPDGHYINSPSDDILLSE